jgi:hypothetical protein
MIIGFSKRILATNRLRVELLGEIIIFRVALPKDQSGLPLIFYKINRANGKIHFEVKFSENFSKLASDPKILQA